MSNHFNKNKSCPQRQTKQGSSDVVSTCNSNADSSNKVCQTETQEPSPVDRCPAVGKGHDPLVNHDYTPQEPERLLSGKLMELQKEVCISR